MKQVLQSLRTGVTEVVDVPCPAVRPRHLLIRTSRTLVSAGTERMLVEFGKAGWIAKARQQPERVGMVIDKIKTDGLLPTIDAVMSKLDQPLPLGYCNAGTVMEVGPDMTGFSIGDRVVSNGKHAEVVAAPMTLCARIPDSVSDDAAAFTVLGAIGLEGVRLVAPTLGECVVVTGLGLIGLVTVQLLRAHGCRVLGLDFDGEKLALARQFGAETVDLSTGVDPVAAARAYSRDRGVDAVIITASTDSNAPVHQAAQMCRKRGRIVLVGVTGLELSRADFYEKELSFQVSCSYGPGRYDPTYEEQGQDYPVGFVRWTEQRNFEAVLDMMADGRLDVEPLVSHRFAISDAERAYDLISGDTPSLGVLLEYPSAVEQPDQTLRRSTTLIPRAAGTHEGKAGTPRLGFIGSGNYGTAVLIPAFKAAGVQLQAVVSSNGVSGVHAARKFGFASASTDAAAVIADESVDTVAIVTRHDTHARLVCDALRAGKHVFVEKPLALTHDELRDIEESYSAAAGASLLMVGFNRRFAPHVVKMASLLAGSSEPRAFVVTVNAGAIPSSHWTQDRRIGGGRIVGEGCHFIDLLRFLAASPIVGFEATSLGAAGGVRDDKASITLRFANGSIGTLLYLANGHKSFPKERVEVFVGGRILQLDNYRVLRGFGWPGFQRMRLWRQDKGQRDCVQAFANAVRNGAPSPIPFDELMEVSRATIDIADRLR